MIRSRRRTERTVGRQVVLGARDEALLRALARFRVARSADLGRLFFAGRSRERASQRLRRLFDARWLDLRVARLAESNIYSLGPRGRQWAKEHGLDVGRVPVGGLDHHLAIVECWSRIAASIAPVSGLRLVRFRPDWEIRSELGAGWLVIPDALIELGSVSGEERFRLALEVDLGSEFTRVLQSKLEGYEQLRLASRELLGWPDFALVVVTAAGGEQRHLHLVQLVRREGRVADMVLRLSEWPAALIARIAPTALPTACSNGGNREGAQGASGTTASPPEGAGYSG